LNSHGCPAVNSIARRTGSGGNSWPVSVVAVKSPRLGEGLDQPLVQVSSVGEGAAEAEVDVSG